MRPFLLLILVASLAACKKDKEKAEQQLMADGGKWIEKTLRLDTLDFNVTPFGALDNDNKAVKFNTRMDRDPVNSIYLVHNNIYSYYFESGYVYLRSFVSSSTFYPKYKFRWTAGNKSFIIQRFYTRNTLPEEIEFIPLR